MFDNRVGVSHPNVRFSEASSPASWARQTPRALASSSPQACPSRAIENGERLPPHTARATPLGAQPPHPTTPAPSCQITAQVPNHRRGRDHRNCRTRSTQTPRTGSFAPGRPVSANGADQRQTSTSTRQEPHQESSQRQGACGYDQAPQPPSLLPSPGDHSPRA